jgi:hypothetical protein
MPTKGCIISNPSTKTSYADIFKKLEHGLKFRVALNSRNKCEE